MVTVDPGRPAELPPVVAVVQARMSSSRLPGKVLLPLAGRPALEWTLRRLGRATAIDSIVVATSRSDDDDAIERFARERGVVAVRGSRDDVLDRHLVAAESAGAAQIVRIPADKPLVDPATVDRVVSYHLATDADYSANVSADHPEVRRCPLGFEVEAVSMGALRVAASEAVEPHQREHVLPFLYENPDRFRITRVPMPAEVVGSPHRLNLDTTADHRMLAALFEQLDDPVSASMEEIVAVLDADPELAGRNTSVEQRSHLSVAGREPT